MRAGQRKLRLGVIEVCDLLPIRGVMAFLAVHSKLSLVFVGVTGNALCRKTQESPVQILDPNQGLLRRIDPACGVTLRAYQAGVLSIQHPSGLQVIELLLRRHPLHQHEVRSIVFRVAGRAALARRVALHHPGVIALATADPHPDLSVAVETPECLGTPGFMTLRTVRRAFEGRMGS